MGQSKEAAARMFGSCEKATNGVRRSGTRMSSIQLTFAMLVNSPGYYLLVRYILDYLKSHFLRQWQFVNHNNSK
jgi:hypothetical protein